MGRPASAAVTPVAAPPVQPLCPRGHSPGVSTLADWVGQSSAPCQPLIETIAAHVMAAHKLHADGDS